MRRYRAMIRGRASDLAIGLLALILFGAVAWGANGRRDKKKQPATPPPPHWMSVEVQGGLAYYGRTADLVVFDIQEDDNFPEVAQVLLDEPAQALSIRDGIALVASGRGGMAVLDLEDLENVIEVGHWIGSGSAVDVVRNESYAYLALRSEGLHVIDLSKLDAPRSVARISTRNEVAAVAIGDGWLATAEGRAGVRIFDLERPGAPRERHSLHQLEGARDVAWRDGKLWVARGRHGWSVYDLAASGEPKLRFDGSEDGTVYGFAWLESGSAVLLRGAAGIEIVRFGEDGRLIRVSQSTLKSGYPAYSGSVLNHRLYLACDVAGFAVVDLSDPLTPQTIFPRPRKLKIRFP